MTDKPEAPTLESFLPAGAADEFRATAGGALAPGTPPADREALVEALRGVHDPEIPVNIYDLGLIYRLEITDEGSVFIEMTLTAPGCPVAGEMPGQVAEAAAAVAGVGEVEVVLVWEPGWTPERMSEDAKLALGMF